MKYKYLLGHEFCDGRDTIKEQVLMVFLSKFYYQQGSSDQNGAEGFQKFCKNFCLVFIYY